MRCRSVLVALAAVVLVGTVVPSAQGVVGGEEPKPGQFPFMASIQFRSVDEGEESGSHFCGGSVISSRWILTAAHCVAEDLLTGAPTDPRDLLVVTGRTNLSTTDGQVLSVDRIKVHPAYEDDADHDAALLHLTSATSAPAIALAGANDENLEASGARVTVAGWGDQAYNGGLGLTASDELLAAELFVVSDADCASQVIDFSDAALAVCADDLLEDACNGDSGGPLFAVKSGRFIEVGIVSRGFACATPQLPGIYTEVNNPSIIKFVTKTTGITTRTKPQPPKGKK